MFFQFLTHRNLISGRVAGAGKKISGARTKERAHELSTRWMLNKKSGGLNTHTKRVAFVSKLIEIGGKDRVLPDDYRWASEEQVKKLVGYTRRLPGLELQHVRIRSELSMPNCPEGLLPVSLPGRANAELTSARPGYGLICGLIRRT